MLKVFIDIRMYDKSGIGTYIKNVVPLTIALLPEVTFILLGNELLLQKQYWGKGDNVHIVDFHDSIYSLREQLKLRQLIPKDADLFWSPHFNIPILSKCKLLTTVHDVFHLAMPQFVLGWHKKLYARIMYNAVAQKSDAIITVSDFTKNEFVKYTGCKMDKIFTIHNGIDKNWCLVSIKEKICEEPFFIFVGNVKPHKNLRRLIIAWKQVQKQIPHKLFIIGKKDGFITGDDNIASLIEEGSDKIFFTGYIGDDELKQYYVQASGLIFPSLYEGFGLPPLEAMACGCPSIVADIASLREVCAEAVLYCDPYDITDIAEKICMLVYNDDFREKLVLKGKQQANRYSWEECADKTAAIVRRILKI